MLPAETIKKEITEAQETIERALIKLEETTGVVIKGLKFVHITNSSGEYIGKIAVELRVGVE